MPSKEFYLQPRHAFPYRAWAPWPEMDMAQQDWIEGVEKIEEWLETYVGPSQRVWAWDRVDLCYQGRYVGVAFNDPRHRFLFCLRWC